MAGDPNWANCVYFPDFTGANGNTTFTDQSDSAHVITTVGNANTQSNKLALDGTGDFLTVPDSADFNFGAGQFTIACIANVTAFSAVDTVISQYDVNERSWWLKVNSSGNYGLNWSTDGSSVAGLNGVGPVTAGVDAEILVDRDASNVLRVYKDGTMIGSVANAVTYYDSTSTVRIGSTGITDFDYFGGDITQVKVWKGVAVVGSDSGYTTSSNGLFDVGPLVASGSTGPRGLRIGPGRMGIH